MLIPARILHDLVGQVMAFAAQRVGSIDARIRIRCQIAYQATRHQCLAEDILPLEDMRPLGTVRAVRAGAAEFSIVVAVVAIGAKNLRAHRAALRHSVQIQHVAQKTGLGKRTASQVCDRMTRGRGYGELRNDVERIARGDGPHRRISVNG